MVNIEKLKRKYKLSNPAMITKPTMPRLEYYSKYLERIWKSKWMTNMAEIHQEFEKQLNDYLGAKYNSLFCNGTTALLVALKAFNLDCGEVITTPFTFPATTNVLYWSNLTPVFCDIEKKTFNLDPNKIENLISRNTKAILPVHIFGNPCDVEALEKIAEKHGLLVIYDAAHAFGVKYKNRPIFKWGDVTMLSFHATKLFTTIEGGALISKSSTVKEKIDFLKNFGVAGEDTVVDTGINGKMNEFQAAFGLLQLKMIDEEIAARKKITYYYRKKLKGIPGMTYIDEIPDVSHNYSYFPVLIDKKIYGMNRSELYDQLKKFNIFTRKYFYPLCSRISCFSKLPSASKENLPLAEWVAENILCLPIYGTLEEETVEIICNLLAELAR